MENDNNTAPVEPVQTNRPLFRDGSIMSVFMHVAMTINGDFDIKDLVNGYKEIIAKTGMELGNPVRNARYVVMRMQKEGLINKVKRGRWVKATK